MDAAKSDTETAYGIPGLSAAFANRFSMTLETGKGEHGGLGKYEQNPFLMAIGGGFAAGSQTDQETSAVDIAPTVLRHLDRPRDGMDGVALSRQ